jgi:hypothetical protein
MAALSIKLLPFMDLYAQEFALNNLARLCIINVRNQLKACKNGLLLTWINLLSCHEKFNSTLIG